MKYTIVIPENTPNVGKWINDRFFFQSSKVYKFIKSKNIDFHDSQLLQIQDIRADDLLKSDTVNLEICSGNGSWICERALRDKNVSWIAVERKLCRAKKIFSKSVDLGNIIVACSDAFLFCLCRLNSDSIDNCFINFPDPWPKGRHEKHRIFSKEFVDQLSRVIKKDGNLCVVTDNENLSENSSKLICENMFTKTTFTDHEKTNYGESFFHKMFVDQGKTIFFTKFISTK